MKEKRLLKLADLLDEDAKHKKGAKFDIGEWGTVTDLENPMSCGTTACAMGLAAISGKFKRAGLAAKYVMHYEEKSTTYYAIRFLWDGDQLGGIDAAVNLFGISIDQAQYLFGNSVDMVLPNDGEGGKAERQLAKIIRKFVKDPDSVPVYR